MNCLGENERYFIQQKSERKLLCRVGLFSTPANRRVEVQTVFGPPPCIALNILYRKFDKKNLLHGSRRVQNIWRNNSLYYYRLLHMFVFLSRQTRASRHEWKNQHFLFAFTCLQTQVTQNFCSIMFMKFSPRIAWDGNIFLTAASFWVIIVILMLTDLFGIPELFHSMSFIFSDLLFKFELVFSSLSEHPTLFPNISLEILAFRLNL